MMEMIYDMMVVMNVIMNAKMNVRIVSKVNVLSVILLDGMLIVIDA